MSITKVSLFWSTTPSWLGDWCRMPYIGNEGCIYQGQAIGLAYRRHDSSPPSPDTSTITSSNQKEWTLLLKQREIKHRSPQVHWVRSGIQFAPLLEHQFSPQRLKLRVLSAPKKDSIQVEYDWDSSGLPYFIGLRQYRTSEFFCPLGVFSATQYVGCQGLYSCSCLAGGVRLRQGWRCQTLSSLGCRIIL